MLHCRKLSYRIKRLPEGHLGLVYHLSSFLLGKEGFVLIHHIDFQMLAAEMFKVFKGVSFQSMAEVFSFKGSSRYTLTL